MFISICVYLRVKILEGAFQRLANAVGAKVRLLLASAIPNVKGEIHVDIVIAISAIAGTGE
jgi:hypothetical protein